MNIQILKSTSKRGFKRLVGINRETSPAHVNKLKASILRLGMRQPVVVADLTFITGKKETYIIDGQHKYEACLAAGIDIPYTTIDNITNYEELVETLAMFNSSSKSWKLTDYVMAWGSINNDYKRLLFYHNKYNMELGLTAEILAGRGHNLYKGPTAAIKSGKFKISDEEKAAVIISNLADINRKLPKMERDIYRHFVRNYIKLLDETGKKYDHTVMLRYIHKQKDDLLVKCQSAADVENFFNQYKSFILGPVIAEL